MIFVGTEDSFFMTVEVTSSCNSFELLHLGAVTKLEKQRTEEEEEEEDGDIVNASREPRLLLGSGVVYSCCNVAVMKIVKKS